MAIRQGNPGIVTKDLQLYYNRDSLKSFKGQSRINYLWGGHFPDGKDMPQEFGSNPTNTVVYETDNPSLYSDYVLRSTSVGGSLYTEYQLNIYALEPSTTYCMSCWYAQDPTFDGNKTMFHARAYATSSNNPTSAGAGYLVQSMKIGGRTWEYRYETITTPSDSTGLIEWYLGYSSQNTQGYRYFTNIQFEKGSYPTPYNDIANNINVRNETTTNILTSTRSRIPVNWYTDGSGQGSIGTYSYIENETAIRVTDVNSNTRFFALSIVASASTKYTFSIKYRKVSGTPTLRFQIQFYDLSTPLSNSFPTTSDIHIYDEEGWQLAWYTVTSPVNTNRITWFVQDGDDYTTYTHSYDLKEPQIQTGAYPTAWTQSSCTSNVIDSSGGVYDLSGNGRNSNLTNISFDSSGYYFNGSSDYIDLGSDITFKSSGGWSVSSWFNLTQVVSGNLYNFIGASAITYNSWYWTVYQSKLALWNISPGGWYYGSTTILANTWYNAVLVCSYDGTKYQMYLNGVAEGGTHVTYTWNSDYSGLKIGYVGRGDSSNGRYFYGKYPSFQVYNQALSSTDVLRNFNAGRKAYGI